MFNFNFLQKFIMLNNAFAIKFGTSKKDTRLKSLLNKLTKFYPELSIEGLTDDFRKEKVTSISSAIIPGGAIVAVERENKDLLCFGTSKKYDVSFETKKATKLCGIQVIKILDIKKDFKEILDRLGKFIAGKYPEQSAINIMNGWEKPKKVLRYSQYVSVDGICMSYKKFNKVNKSKKKNRLDSVSSLINLLIK